MFSAIEKCNYNLMCFFSFLHKMFALFSFVSCLRIVVISEG